jgi:hypothetical protein
MMFDFECRSCKHLISVRSKIGTAPKVPLHCRRRARRLYQAPRFHINYDRVDYVDRAYRGEESVPGMSTAEVRQTVDMMKRQTA